MGHLLDCCTAATFALENTKLVNALRCLVHGRGLHLGPLHQAHDSEMLGIIGCDWHCGVL
eukprot:364625-Chlamydomonas_euryale.AAC.3